jgi:hypothetical protein
MGAAMSPSGRGGVVGDVAAAPGAERAEKRKRTPHRYAAMNLPKLPRTLALAALTLSLTAGLRAEGPAEATLRDHVDAAVPAHLGIEELRVRLVGSPATKAKAELTLRAAETLYVETAKNPELKPIAAELTADLRAQEPKALRLLKVVTPEGSVTKPLHFDFSVGAGGSGLGLVDGKKFQVFGRPRAEFPVEAVAADTAEGQAVIAAWEKSVADYNLALKTHESRTRTDRNTGLLEKVGGQATRIWDHVRGGGTVQPATENAGTAAPQAKPATPENSPAKGEAKDKAGDTLKHLGGILGTFGAR